MSPYFSESAGVALAPSRHRGVWRDLSKITLALLVMGCSAKPYLNEPVTQLAADRERKWTRLVVGDRAPEVLVMLALSGGGTRASALAYGVMQELAAITVQTSRGEQRLLDEVDIISSVSGGSFVSAYYGLYGDRIFADFEERFLRREVQSDLAKGMMSPRNWRRQASPYYGRSDMAAEYYDAHIFDGRTFGDMRRPEAPLVIINSTDIGSGSRVSFVHAMFDLICSDLDSYPVSRAVMASAAVPGAATPITLQNHAGQCGYELPEWLYRSLQESTSSFRREKAESFAQYLNAERRPWIHLADGGIADNLGLRAFYSFFSLEHNPRRVFEEFGHDQVRRILIISVNAAVVRERAWSTRADIPKVAQVLNGMANIQLRRYTADTLHIVRESYQSWVDQLWTEQRPLTFEFAEITFSSLADPVERAYFNALPTSLELEDEAVDRLIAVGRELVRQSPDIQRFVAAPALR